MVRAPWKPFLFFQFSPARIQLKPDLLNLEELFDETGYFEFTQDRFFSSDGFPMAAQALAGTFFQPFSRRRVQFGLFFFPF